MAWAIFNDDHVTAIQEIQNSPSERVTAIVGGAILDDTLQRTLSERFRNDEDITNKLMKVSGALGNTGPKIDVLFLLGAFDTRIRDALYGISEVRNFFAHNLNTSFSSDAPKMKSAIAKLALHAGRKYYWHHFFDRNTEQEIEKIENNRDIFLVNLKLCLLVLMRDRVGHQTHSNIPRSAEEIEQLYRANRERNHESGKAST